MALETLEPRTFLSADHLASVSGEVQDVVVAVIDSGIDYKHPLLRENIWTNPNEIPGDGIDNDGNGYADDVHGWDWAENDNDPADEYGHGTLVGGVVVSEAKRLGAGAEATANVQLMPLRFMDGSGAGTVANALAAMNYAIDLRVLHHVNVRVINNSWRGSSLYSQEFFKAIRRANEAGILVVCAAGNGGPDGTGDDNDAMPSYPASYALPNVISVAAADDRGNLARFSNFGATTVHIAAPGTGIRSALPGKRMGTSSGTSMAAPFVSAAAATAWMVAPNLDPSQMRDSIERRADRSSALAHVVRSGGMLNGLQVLDQLATGQNHAAAEAQSGISRAERRSSTSGAKASTSGSPQVSHRVEAVSQDRAGVGRELGAGWSMGGMEVEAEGRGGQAGLFSDLVLEPFAQQSLFDPRDAQL